MSLFQKLRIPNQVLGVEYCNTPDGIRVFCSHLKKVKNSIELIEKKEINFLDLNSFIVSKNIAFRIMISGKGILSQENSSINSTDFLIQQLGDLQHVIRKENIKDLILDNINKKNFSGFLLGSSPLQWAKDSLSVQYINSFCYRNQNTKAEWDIETKENLISDQTIESNYTGSYLTALSIYFEETIRTANETETLNFYENILYTKSIIGIGIFVLVMAIANFFVFDYLNQENENLISNNQFSEDIYQTYKNLEQEIKIKKKLLFDLGSDKKTFQSFYTDRIAFSTPKSISLINLEVAPIDAEKFKKEHELTFDRTIIHINGFTNSAVDFNNWLDLLKSFPWIKSIEVENYKFDNQKNNSNFNLKITLR